jgi:hypothetical protein
LEAYLKLKKKENSEMPSFMLQDVQKVPYQIAAVDADGNPASLAAGDSINVSSSDSTMAVVVPDATPAAGFVASGFIVGASKLGTVQINAAVTHADGSAGPTGAVSIDIVSGPAASLSMGFGTPVAQ